ncbi:MAG: permease [Microcoleaceae cyanobacterium]
MSSTLSNQFNNLFTLFFSLLVEAIPFLLLGVLFSGILLWFVDERKLIAILPRHPFFGALVGSLVGFLFPVCECGNVPVARRLLMQGIPPQVAVSFLLAAPTLNPIVIWSTWVAFRDQPEIVLLRVLFSLIIATTIGWVFSFQKDLRPLLQPAIARFLPDPNLVEDHDSVLISPLLKSGTFLLGESQQPLRLDAMPMWEATMNPTLPLKNQDNEKKSGWFVVPDQAGIIAMLNSMVQELRELGGMLVLGSAIAAIIQVAIPRELVLSLGQGQISSIVAMLLLATIVSICSTVDAFFALSFAGAFTSGSLLAFLVFGPMIDIKSVGLMLSIFKPRAIIYLIVLAAQLTFIMTLLVNLYAS